MKLNAMALANKWLFVKVGNIHERTATAPSMSGRRFVQKAEIIALSFALTDPHGKPNFRRKTRRSLPPFILDCPMEFTAPRLRQGITRFEITGTRLHRPEQFGTPTGVSRM